MQANSDDHDQELLFRTNAEIGVCLALEPRADQVHSKYGSYSRSLKCSGRAWCLTGAGLSLALLLAPLLAVASSLTSSLQPARVTEALRQAEEQAPNNCSGDSEDCTATQCCNVPGTQCYEKTNSWAACLPDCERGPRPGDIDKVPWSCKTLGSRFEGRTPKLFCFSVVRTDSYEMGLVEALLQEGVGIFACDGFMVLTQREQVSLRLPERSNSSADELPTTRIAGADGLTIGTSGQGTAVNAELFQFVWKTILADGRYRQHDWTVKVDPDAVLLPWRLQEHLRSHTYRDLGEGGSFYVVNCNLYPANPNFPMIYGAVEVFSTSALQAYEEGEPHCSTSLPWKDWQWGEDKFMSKCMELLGVTRLEDFKQVGDQLCTFSGCGDTSRASYHPFKDVQSWMACWDEANAEAVSDNLTI